MWKTDKGEFEQKVYALWTYDENIRKESTSGGAFSALAEQIIKKGGCVFGAALDKDINVVHICVDQIKDLSRLRGSKYVQSDLGNTYNQIKNKLMNNKIVLFSGTPCQVAGLYSFLGQDYKGQLFTIDLVCHGVPSPLVFSEYKKFLEKKYCSTIKEISFRSKKYSWWSFGMQVVFLNGEVYFERSTHDPFLRAFLREYDLRPSCHNCQFNHFERPSDITLSDFWWYTSEDESDYDTDKGISMVLVNSLNGATLFKEIKNYRIIEKTIEDARRTNRALRECFPPNANRDAFWNDFRRYGFEDVIDKYLYPEKCERGKYTLFINSHYHKLPRLLKNIIKLYYYFNDDKFCRDNLVYRSKKSRL